MTNDDGRVSVLDLPDNGLRGELTNALEALRGLERLDLSGNPGLGGTLPPGLMELPGLAELYTDGTGACPPDDPVFQQWLSGISFRGGMCGDEEEPGDRQEPGDEEEPGRGEEGGGCSMAPDGRAGPARGKAALNLL